jgi:hypothetical protein
MLLQHLLFVCACTIASTRAAVKFYGSDRPEGDYVTCEVANATDEDVSAGLGMLYFPGEIVPESNDLQFADEPLVCGDFASVAVEFACSDLGGDAICVPIHTADEAEEDPTGSDDKSAEAVEERSGKEGRRLLQPVDPSMHQRIPEYGRRVRQRLHQAILRRGRLNQRRLVHEAMHQRREGGVRKQGVHQRQSEVREVRARARLRQGADEVCRLPGQDARVELYDQVHVARFHQHMQEGGACVRGV